MNTTLANDHNIILQILDKTKDLASDYFAQQNTLPPGRFIPDIEMEILPQKGIGALAALEKFHEQYADKISNSAGPGYFGFVTGGATPASVAGDWLVSTYDQNAAGSNDSIAPQIERQTIDFIQQLFGLDKSYFGSFVTGATVSNFTNLAIARQWVGEQLGFDCSQDGLSDTEAIKVLSGTPHSSIMKSLSMLGVGRKALIKIETLPDREAVDIVALEAALKKINGPAIVVANAGTVNTVDFDDLVALGELKLKYNFWLHVDAAFGGFAAVSDKFSRFMNGINAADSVTVDAHKWLNVPYDSAMQFTRHKKIQLKVFQNSAAYLGDPEESPDFLHYTPENSRRFRALPSWFTLIAYGREGYKEIIDRNCACAAYLGELISASSDFRLLASVRMNVVCFTFKQNEVDFQGIQDFLNAVRDDGRVFFTPTLYKGKAAIRAAISNWLTEKEQMDAAYSVLHELAAKIEVTSRV
ncbi:MAG: pyridoxal-dependent decarboxylase [Chryseolinea sp.]